MEKQYRFLQHLVCKNLFLLDRYVDLMRVVKPRGTASLSGMERGALVCVGVGVQEASETTHKMQIAYNEQRKPLLTQHTLLLSFCSLTLVA